MDRGACPGPTARTPSCAMAVTVQSLGCALAEALGTRLASRWPVGGYWGPPTIAGHLKSCGLNVSFRPEEDAWAAARASRVPRKRPRPGNILVSDSHPKAFIYRAGTSFLE